MYIETCESSTGDINKMSPQLQFRCSCMDYRVDP